MYWRVLKTTGADRTLTPVDFFYAYGREIRAHGFLQREMREMKGLVEGKRSERTFGEIQIT